MDRVHLGNRTVDEAHVREAIDNLIAILHGFGEDAPLEAVTRVHELIAMNMATLERYTRG